MAGENPVAPVAEGDVLAGRYRVDKVLAVGGMGVVVAARHVQLGQKVALKFLLSSVAATSEAAQRFQREARAAALLRSEHVARVIDVGELESGAPYMVMEFLEGGDLASVLDREGPLPIDVAVEYILQACEGLAEAHAAHIIHRDLKPSNLFRTPRPDGSPLIKILDFGISKMEDSVAGGGAMTATSAVLGSPLYMSPEQMQSSKNVDARTDVWSLGVVLQQLLTGRPSFDAETLAGLCISIATKPPRLLRDTMQKAPPELEAIILRCLEKRPEDRFANVAELASALAPFAPEARHHVDRARRLLLGTTAPPLSADASSQPRILVDTNGATRTDPLGRTKTALAGSQPSIHPPRRSLVPFAIGAVAVLAVGAIGTVALTRSSSTPSANGPSSSDMHVTSEAHTARVESVTPTDTGTTISVTSLPTTPTSTGVTPHANTGTNVAPHASTAKSVAATSAPPPVPSQPLTGFSLDRK